MLREFNHKLALIVKKRMTAKVILLALLSLQTISIMADPPKAVWYRYYDSKGIATQKKMRNMRRNVQQQPSNASQILN